MKYWIGFWSRYIRFVRYWNMWRFKQPFLSPCLCFIWGGSLILHVTTFGMRLRRIGPQLPLLRILQHLRSTKWQISNSKYFKFPLWSSDIVALTRTSNCVVVLQRGATLLLYDRMLTVERFTHTRGIKLLLLYICVSVGLRPSKLHTSGTLLFIASSWDGYTEVEVGNIFCRRAVWLSSSFSATSRFFPNTEIRLFQNPTQSLVT